MEKLPVNQYSNLLTKFPLSDQAKWFLEYIQTHQNGHVFVDNIISISSFLILTPSLEIFYGGNYSENFMFDSIEHIKTNILPFNEDKLAFFYPLNDIWKNHLIADLSPYTYPEFGQLIIRRIHQLNLEKYHRYKEVLKVLSSDYQFQEDFQSKEYRIKILFEGKEIGYAMNAGEAMNIVDIDVFVDEHHRRKNVSSHACVLFIDHYNNIGKAVQWGCFTVNQASCNMAVKLGFEISSEAEVILANFEEEKS
ncbi:MAG: GNAT family N-acetyltransferase [Candidatus Izemoplasmatales bacterium]